MHLAVSLKIQKKDQYFLIDLFFTKTLKAAYMCRIFVTGDTNINNATFGTESTSSLNNVQIPWQLIGLENRGGKLTLTGLKYTRKTAVRRTSKKVTAKKNKH